MEHNQISEEQTKTHSKETQNKTEDRFKLVQLPYTTSNNNDGRLSLTNAAGTATGLQALTEDDLKYEHTNDDKSELHDSEAITRHDEICGRIFLNLSIHYASE